MTHKHTVYSVMLVSCQGQEDTRKHSAGQEIVYVDLIIARRDDLGPSKTADAGTFEA